MKTHLIASLLLLPALLHAQSDIVPLTKKRSDNTLVTSFETGAKTIKISATGTLEFETGFTLNGGTILRDAMGASTGGSGGDDEGKLAVFAPGGLLQSVQFVAWDGASFGTLLSDRVTFSNGSNYTALLAPASVLGSYLLRLPSISANATLISTNDTGTVTNAMLAGSIAVSKLSVASNVATLLGAANYAAMKTLMSLNNVENTALTTWTGSASITTLGTIATGTWNATAIALGKIAQGGATSNQVLSWNGSAWAPATISSGLTNGSTAIASGTNGYVLYNNAGTLGQLATTGSGSVVRATSPVLTGADLGGVTTLGNANNSISRDAGTGNTKIVTATNAFSVVNSSSASIMVATTTGVTFPGMVVDAGTAYAYPGSYPTLPSYENFARGRSYRPGTSVAAFASQIIAPGDIYDGAGITITDAATLYIHGPPFQHPSGAAIGGNKWALWVYGSSRFDGGMAIGSGGTKHDKIKSGVATLVAGTVTVSDSDVIASGTAAASSRIFVTRMTDGGTVGTYSITRVNATSFTITSSSGADTSTVSWLMLNP